MGVLSVHSDRLVETDVPAITAFAYQIAAAWHKATLIQDLQNNLEELRQTQAQLNQAQKMEAIGRLAGGVAHDFNNILTAVIGYSQLLIKHLPSDDPRHADAREILEAGRRASSLTRQLLLFSRQRVPSSRVLSLNEVVTNMERMLRRVIGEDVKLAIILNPMLDRIKGDPGLGLSVVYGIVQQHGGGIAVDSEPGRGSTFNVYLPVIVVAEERDATEAALQPEPQGQGEGILLVEDAEGVRRFVTEMLNERGYHVISASNKQEALEAFEAAAEENRLIFADVVLPDGTALQLVDQLQSRKEDLRVLLCSGYTDARAQMDHIQERGLPFIQKPYTLSGLLQDLREAIEA